MFEPTGLEKLRSKLAALQVGVPQTHVVLGSGYAAALGEVQSKLTAWKPLGDIPFSEIPGMVGSATAPGHGSSFRYYRHLASGKTVCFQLGRLHGYEGLTPRQVVQPVAMSRLLGTPDFILTNASGALTRKYPVGSVLLLKDHVNLTGLNPLSGPNPKDASGNPLGPRFPDMTETYDRAWREKLTAHFRKSGVEANEGLYIGVPGPSFETPAEVELFARWGMDAVGMSTVWESIALRYLGARLAGVSLLCNLAAGLSPHPLTAEEVLEIGLKSGRGILEALFSFLALEERPEERSR